jgi:hypothetical protein
LYALITDEKVRIFAEKFIEAISENPDMTAKMSVG